MIAYTITNTNKVWMIDDSEQGVEIPQWCYTKEGYNVVEELPQDVLDLIASLDLTKQKEKQVKILAKTYTLANSENVEYMDTTFQADKTSQDLIASNLSVGSVPDGFYWKDLANNDVSMTYEDLQGLAATIQARGLINFNKYQELKNLVLSATTPEDVETIVWEN